MTNNEMVKTGLIIVGGLILAPVIIGAVGTVLAYTGTGVANGVRKINFKRQMKNGLKDGSIVKINGEFYNIEQNVEEA